MCLFLDFEKQKIRPLKAIKTSQAEVFDFNRQYEPLTGSPMMRGCHQDMRYLKMHQFRHAKKCEIMASSVGENCAFVRSGPENKHGRDMENRSLI